MRADTLPGRVVAALAGITSERASTATPGIARSSRPGRVIGALARDEYALPRQEEYNRQLLAAARNLCGRTAWIHHKVHDLNVRLESLSRGNRSRILVEKIRDRLLLFLIRISDPGHRYSILVYSYLALLGGIPWVLGSILRLNDLGALAKSLATARPPEPDWWGGDEFNVLLTETRNDALCLARDLESSAGLADKFARRIGPFGRYLRTGVSKAIDLALCVSGGDLSRSNLTGLDLRHTDSLSTRLDCAMWSEETQWPEDRRDEIRLNSREVAPGIFEVVGPGTVTSRTRSKPRREQR